MGGPSHRGRRLIAIAIAVGILVGLLVGAVMLARRPSVRSADRPSLPVRGRAPGSATPAGSGSASISGGAVEQEKGLPAVAPLTSAAYPPVPAADTSDPDLYAQAFATELLSQNYAGSSREALESWAQWEDAPVDQAGVPRSVGAKILVQSLDSPAMSGGTETIIPSPAAWATLASEAAFATVSHVSAQIDPHWESAVMGGYQPADPLMSARLVTATVTLHTTISGQAQTTVESVAFTLAVGTAANHAGYGAMATYGYAAEVAG
jgi:hypothetical protein